MTQSVEQTILRFEEIAAAQRKEHRDPRKARAFLVRAGIAKVSKKSPTKIRLVKPLR